MRGRWAQDMRCDDDSANEARVAKMDERRASPPESAIFAINGKLSTVLPAPGHVEILNAHCRAPSKEPASRHVVPQLAL